jgi:cyclopropane fatty-acyl-phospholipid synthase-like methyltransferase
MTRICVRPVSPRRLIGAIVVAASIAGSHVNVGAQAPSRRPDVRYLPTPQNVVDAMLELAHVTASDVVYDLGSGDGRIPITAARRYGARGVGIELDPALVRLSEENAAKAGVQPLVRFVVGDLFEQDFSDATVVALFLYPGMNIELIPKLRALKPGARIVSHHFAMGDRWVPDDTRDVNGLQIYLWTVR